jgi:hypothetical protein
MLITPNKLIGLTIEDVTETKGEITIHFTDGSRVDITADWVAERCGGRISDIRLSLYYVDETGDTYPITN